jgi:hypothetical protein
MQSRRIEPFAIGLAASLASQLSPHESKAGDPVTYRTPNPPAHAPR